MAYKSKSFTFWVSYYDVAQELTPREQGEFFKAIMDYMFLGEDTEAQLRKPVRICFKAIKANLKRSVANRRVIGDESDENRGEVPQPENALNLKLKLNIKNKDVGSGSGAGLPAPPSCPKCGTPMEFTAITKGSEKHKLQKLDCPKCRGEVWVDAVI